MNKAKILVIEDEVDILEVIRYNLEREGFRITGAKDGESGLLEAKKEDPDLVLLDLMLPGLDGIEVCRQLKMDQVTRAIPVIIITAKGEESDVVLGLGMGADDYIVKPFSTREMVARVKAVLRRAPLRESLNRNERITAGKVIIDAARHDVIIDGKSEHFTATEFRLLHFLSSHAGRVFTRDQLLSRAINEDAVVIDRNIDVHIRSIRKKLGKFSNLVETIRGVGYRFIETE